MKTPVFTRVCAILAIGAGVIFAATSASAATTYTWKTSVTEGVWEDAANWEASSSSTAGYPQASDTAIFAADTTATVSLSESVTLTTINLSSANVDVTLKRGESAAAMPVITTKFESIGGKVTLDGVKIAASGNVSVGAGAVLTLQNAAELTVPGNFNCYNNEAGGTVRLKGKSKLSTNWVNFGPCTLEIDDSTFESGQGTRCWAKTKNNVTTTIRFLGESPLYLMSYSSDTRYYFCGGSESPNLQVVFEFVVPEGGYKTVPLQNKSNNSHTVAFGVNMNTPNTIYGSATVKIAKDSPLFSRLSTGKELEMTLMSWAKTGLSTKFLSTLETKKGEFVWGEAASNGSPLTLGYKVKGCGMVIRIQ